MGRFRDFSIAELNMLEAALCQKGIRYLYLVDEVRAEGQWKEEARDRMKELLGLEEPKEPQV